MKLEELLEATSFMSNYGLKPVDSSEIDLSSGDAYGSRLNDSHKKTQSLGKNSTKDMTDKLLKN